MWCRQCQQDVPGLTAIGGQFTCPRCKAALWHPAVENDSLTATDDARTFVLEDWELEGDLAHIARALGDAAGRSAPGASSAGSSENQDPRRRARYELPPWQTAPLGVNGALAAPEAAAEEAPSRHEAAPQLQSSAASIFLLVGTMALVCGGVLLAWAIVGARADLWSLGIPIAVLGQLGLLLGLVLQLERMWHDYRQAQAKLQHVGRQLDDLRATTELIGTTYGAPGGPFYSHLAHGAPPEMLLHDLKGQLDLLAVRMSQQNRVHPAE